MDFLWISVGFVGFWVCKHYGSPAETFEFLTDFVGIRGLLGPSTWWLTHKIYYLFFFYFGGICGFLGLCTFLFTHSIHWTPYGFLWILCDSGCVHIKVHPQKPLNFLWISVDLVFFRVCTHYGAATEAMEFLMDFGEICGCLLLHAVWFTHRAHWISYGFRWILWASGCVHNIAHPQEPLDFLWISVEFVGFRVCKHMVRAQTPLNFLWISVEFVGFWVCMHHGPPTQTS